MNYLSLLNLDRFLSLQIDITNACNLTCSHCYHPHHTNHGSLTFLKWKNIIIEYEELLIELGANPHLIICGGEPLLSPLLPELIHFISTRSLKYHVSILTNATLIHRYDLNSFKLIQNLDFQVSLDGPTELTHDSYRGNGSFTSTMHGIQKLLDENFNISILATLTMRNSKYIKDFFKIAEKYKIPKVCFTRLILEGQAVITNNNNIDGDLTPLELKKVFEMIVYYSAYYKIETNTDMPLMNLIHPLLGKRQRFEEGIVVDYKGNLMVSSRSRQKLGNVLEKGLRFLYFNHPLLNKFRDLGQFECFRCEHFTYCGGDRNASFAYTKDFFKKDPLCWINNHTQGEIA